MPVKTTGSTLGKDFVPVPVVTPIWDITVGSTSIQDSIIDATMNGVVTVGTSSFDITIENTDGKYISSFETGDVVKIYADFASGTNQNFEGRIDTIGYRVSLSGITMNLKGRDYGAEAIDRTVTKVYTDDTAISTIFQELITDELPNHSTDFSNIATITATYKPSWQHKPIWAAMQELMNVAKEKTGNEYDFYNDKDKKWHVFKRGSVIGNGSIVYGGNLRTMETIDDLNKLRNKYFLYGKTIESIPTVKSVKDTVLINKYWRKDLVKTDGNAITMEQVRDKVKALKAVFGTVELAGPITCVGLPFVRAGDTIPIISPFCKITSNQNIRSIIQRFSRSGFMSDVNFEEEEKGVVQIFDGIGVTQQEQANIDNTFGMEDAYIGTFVDADYGTNGQTPNSDAYWDTMDDIIVYENATLLQLTKTTGTAVSKAFTADANITQVVVKLSGQNFISDAGENWVTIRVSVDNGVSWQVVTRDTLTNIASIGKRLKVEVTMVSLTTKITGIGILFK